MRQVVQGKVEEIVKWAKEYGNPMRYNRVMDLLCDKDETITQAELDEAWKVLEDRGVTILCENDEEYDAEETDSDTFVPAYVKQSPAPPAAGCTDSTSVTLFCAALWDNDFLKSRLPAFPSRGCIHLCRPAASPFPRLWKASCR